ncbi:MAG TPA: hypothetical protein VIL74_24575 [Pyrinomonadaceae bacterium]
MEYWELWCLEYGLSFQDAVEQAMDWLTSQPTSQLTGDASNKKPPSD